MSRPRKVLVADDSAIIREMLRIMLAPEGYHVIFADDGEKAVEMAANEKPDLVIVDGLMPKLHGFLACKAIKELEDAPRVIMLTGVYTKPTYKWEVRKEYGADDLLTKPVKRDELIDCVKKQLASLPPWEDKIAFTDLADGIEMNVSMESPVGLVFVPATASMPAPGQV
jgi:DNA-binding response OmpR family regulator